MKKYYIGVAIILLMTSSCKKALDHSPLDSLTPDQAFSNEQNLQLYVNSFYNKMTPTAYDIYGGPTFPPDFYQGDMMSDIMAISSVPAYLQGAYSSTQATGWDWTNLRNINYFLANYEKADVPFNKNYYAGIAKFFRAFFYFNMVKKFGDVPWYGQPLTALDSALYKPRDPRTLVMDSVLADINFAIDNITNKKDVSASTITRWVALGLKSRLCLFEGTFRKYHPELGLQGTADVWLRDAVAASNEIMTSGLYSLNSTPAGGSYQPLFISQNPVSSEVIWARVYNVALNIGHDAKSIFISPSYGNKPVFVKRFINTYLNIDGTRFTDNPGYDTLPFPKEVKNRDQRLFQTIRMAPGPAPDFGHTNTGYHVLKFTDNLGDRSYNSIPIIRYAEVLLNYAEAEAELNEFTTSIWDNTIGLLRKRAGIKNITMPVTIDTYLQNNFFNDVTSIAILEIRRERAIELACEGFRFNDLIRWKKGILLEKEYDGIYVPQMDVLYDLNEDGVPETSFVSKAPASPIKGVYYFIINKTSVALSAGNKGRIIWQPNIIKSFPDYKYYAPIPYNELILNNKLKQNSGWN